MVVSSYGGGIEVAYPQRKRISFWDCWQGTFRHLQSFIVRGYVADIRKQDAKICWPLFMLDNESSDAHTHTNKLPPLHVCLLKRRSCLKYLHTSSTSEDVTRDPDLWYLTKEKE